MNERAGLAAKDLFLAACSLPEEARSEYLARKCGSDADLAREVASLLQFHADDSHLRVLDTPRVPTVEPAPIPQRIGNFRIERVIGEGGMGVVLEAEQEHPVRRRVAIKLVRSDASSRDALARFASERQVLALMEHPNIARVFEAGETEHGQPYFAMELVPGRPATIYCDDTGMSVRSRLRLFVQVCRAVQHAHQKGIIHRDLKPSNILVMEQDGAPVVKIIDFGVAKVADLAFPRDRTSADRGGAPATHCGHRVGTPGYMSPEQANPDGADIDTRTDVYSLGVVLYELLVGVMPFARAGLSAAGRPADSPVRRDDEPPPPSVRVRRLGDAAVLPADRRKTDVRGLVKILHGDLDAIVGKAMSRSRAGRYGSPAELAEDIERHLRHESIRAVPTTRARSVAKFVARHRLAVGAYALGGVALLAGCIGGTIGLVRAGREAEASRRATEVLIGIFQGLGKGQQIGAAASGQEVLDRGAKAVTTQLADQPALQSRVLVAIASAYTEQHQPARARTLLEQALAVQTSQLDPDDPQLADTLIALSVACDAAGDPRASRDAAVRALAIVDRSPDTATVEHARRLECLATALWRVDRIEDASRCGFRAVTILSEAFAASDVELARALVIRAALLRERGALLAARADLERALSVIERAAGVDSPASGMALYELGFTSQRLGDTQRAATLFERSIRALEGKTDGMANADLAYPLTQLAILAAEDQGDLATARSLLERARAIRERTCGPDTLEMSWTLAALGHVALRAGSAGEARTYFERAHDIVTRRLGPDHREVASRLTSLAFVEVRDGRLPQARDMLRRAHQILTASLGANHVKTATALYNLACVDALGGDTRQAIANLREAVTTGFTSPVIFTDPDLRSLQGNPEFVSILDAVRERLRKNGIEPPRV